MTQELDAGNVVEITCCQPGASDGCLMGYAIHFAGTWDGWVVSPHDHRVMQNVVWNVAKAKAIEAVVANWDSK